VGLLSDIKKTNLGERLIKIHAQEHDKGRDQLQDHNKIKPFFQVFVNILNRWGAQYDDYRQCKKP
jgi:hypothetical protein